MLDELVRERRYDAPLRTSLSTSSKRGEEERGCQISTLVQSLPDRIHNGGFA